LPKLIFKREKKLNVTSPSLPNKSVVTVLLKSRKKQKQKPQAENVFLISQVKKIKPRVVKSLA
jgi:hypothetical protein